MTARTPPAEQPKGHCDHEVVCRHHFRSDYMAGVPCKDKCAYDTRSRPHPAPAAEVKQNCYDGTICIDGKSDACNICYIPLQRGEKISCNLHPICRYCKSDCFNYNPDFKCDFDTRTCKHSIGAQQRNAQVIRELEKEREEHEKEALEQDDEYETGYTRACEKAIALLRGDP